MSEHAPRPLVKATRGVWSAACTCGWTNDYPTEWKANEGWRDHVVRARYEEAMSATPSASG